MDVRSVIIGFDPGVFEAFSQYLEGHIGASGIIAAPPKRHVAADISRHASPVACHTFEQFTENTQSAGEFLTLNERHAVLRDQDSALREAALAAAIEAPPE